VRVLGRELVDPFDSFWETLGPEVPVAGEQIEEGGSAVFGDQGADVTAPKKPSWASLPDDDLAYHAAHELAHIVLLGRGFPRTSRGTRYPPGSAEAMIGGDLEEMVIHPALHKLIEPFGFRWEFIQRRMCEGAVNGLRSSSAPAPGTPWSFTWAVRYCELRIELPDERWNLLRDAYRERSRWVCELGEELLAIMRDVGWGTREQALEAMVRSRDALGMGIEDRVLVVDGLSGAVT